MSDAYRPIKEKSPSFRAGASIFKGTGIRLLNLQATRHIIMPMGRKSHVVSFMYRTSSVVTQKVHVRPNIHVTCTGL